MVELLYFPKGTFSRRFGDGFFTFEVPSSYCIATKDPCWCQLVDVVYYKIAVRRGKTSWFVEKRFNDFCRLAEELAAYKTSQGALSSAALPALPAKTWFRVNNDPNFIEERRVALTSYLEEAARALSQQKLIDGSPIDGFLELAMPHPEEIQTEK